MKRIWQVGRGGVTPPQTASALQRLLLRQRGIAEAAQEHFFAPLYERDIHDPLTLSDMPVAVDRLFAAIGKHERILVYGDYDADGITSTAILVSVLRDLGADVTPYLPHRAEGYGLNQSVLENLAPDIDLLITVDCGISNAAEVAWLKKKKIDTIIVDHHTIPATLPPAAAIVHPRHPKQMYSCQWLCGAGLAWKVAQALVRDSRSRIKDADYEKWLLDLALVGTVADCVPLLDENRAIVRFGLEVLKRTKRVGLRAMVQTMRLQGSSLTAEDVAFRIVPRLNAAGRMDHAQPALELLLAQDADRADELLRQLNAANQLRQTWSRRIIREAEALVAGSSEPFILVENQEWPAGVVGLVAGRLSEKFNRPAIVIGSNGHQAVGSARSPAATNVLELLQTGEQHLLKLGGHAHAAGFTVQPGALPDFHAALRQAVAEQAPQSTAKMERADSIISEALIAQETIDALHHLEPFGEGNKEPVFILRAFPLLSWRPIGKELQHAKFIFLHGGGR